ncbi:hypothetical protein [Varunaivibrio sulfuroxidans]|uniref:hypothetical protein n=1 Tax=Varunaivibrio sulfuroxidans TaxID=1773489 RepID=UPI00104F3C21|nr:hypothetical protein [Varunaivibrio sulfuroxidans]WES32117.1 hypothetical protein P3M64_07100 [Varunaivibrio sulfuroxidans]
MHLGNAVPLFIFPGWRYVLRRYISHTCLYGALLKNYFEGKIDAFDDLGMLIDTLNSSSPN